MGTGTSLGVPVIGVKKHFCDLANPKNWRTRTCAHVIMDGVHIQIDVSPEFRLQCIWNEINWIDFVILTHGHSDHVMGMDDLRSFSAMKDGEAMLIYSCEDGLQRLRDSFAYAILDRPLITGYPAFKPLDMPNKLQLPCGTICSTLLPHGTFEVLGLIFQEKSTGKKLAYYTDCHEVTPTALDLAKGTDVLVLDALRHQPHNSHLTIDQATAISQRVGAKQTYFTHMSQWVDYDTVNRNLPDKIELAYDGLRVNF